MFTDRGHAGKMQGGKKKVPRFLEADHVRAKLPLHYSDQTAYILKTDRYKYNAERSKVFPQEVKKNKLLSSALYNDCRATQALRTVL